MVQLLIRIGEVLGSSRPESASATCITSAQAGRHPTAPGSLTISRAVGVEAAAGANEVAQPLPSAVARTASASPARDPCCSTIESPAGKIPEECPRSAGASRRNCADRGEPTLLLSILVDMTSNASGGRGLTSSRAPRDHEGLARSSDADGDDACGSVAPART